jgi:hypothetical protein
MDFFGVQSVETVGRCTTYYLLAGPACLWCIVILGFSSSSSSNNEELLDEIAIEDLYCDVVYNCLCQHLEVLHNGRVEGGRQLINLSVGVWNVFVIMCGMLDLFKTIINFTLMEFEDNATFNKN